MAGPSVSEARRDPEEAALCKELSRLDKVGVIKDITEELVANKKARQDFLSESQGIALFRFYGNFGHKVNLNRDSSGNYVLDIEYRRSA